MTCSVAEMMSEAEADRDASPDDSFAFHFCFKGSLTHRKASLETEINDIMHMSFVLMRMFFLMSQICGPLRYPEQQFGVFDGISSIENV